MKTKKRELKLNKDIKLFSPTPDAFWEKRRQIVIKALKGELNEKQYWDELAKLCKECDEKWKTKKQKIR